MIHASRLAVILGPTASGKTALAEHLASVFDGELINADSRQIYKGMNIGTAKVSPSPATSYPPAPRLRRAGKLQATHLIDIIEPNEQFTVADYKKLAIKTISDVRRRNKLPILVGGTGLYTKAIVDNLDIPKVPAQKELREELEKKNEKDLYQMVKKIDPISAQQIDKYNKRRLIRALEVTFVTGQSFLGQTKKGPKLYDTLQIGLDIPKEELLQNIEKRTNEMIAQGLEKEVRNLVKTYGWTPLLLNTIGYKEWSLLRRSSFGYEGQEGKKSKGEVIQEIIKNTKQLVKKQLTWFRAQKEIHWVKGKKETEDLVKTFIKR